MGYWSNIGKSILGISKTGNDVFYSLLSTSPNWGKQTTFDQKLNAVLENPAALYIFLLLPELFSMGEFKLTTKEGKEVEKHPILDFLKNPNTMQTAEQFKWDYMFWRKLGTANLYVDSKILKDSGNTMYFLNGDKIKWDKWFDDNKHTLFLSDNSRNKILERELKYKTKSQEIKFKYSKLIQFFDISNGIQGWFSSPSRVDALYKIISNSEKAIASKNINAEFTSKFLVSGKFGIENTAQLPMGESDKKSIRDTMRSSENVYPTKTQTGINRFVDKPAILKSLDEAYMNDAFIIGKMLNIPKDVIEMLGDSTYENQEKARASVVSYCLQPDANDLCSGILRYFDLSESFNLHLDYSNLPFVQVFEKDKADVSKLKAEAFIKLVDAGADQKQVADMLGMGDYLTSFSTPNQRNQSDESKLSKVI